MSGACLENDGPQRATKVKKSSLGKKERDDAQSNGKVLIKHRNYSGRYEVASVLRRILLLLFGRGAL